MGISGSVPPAGDYCLTWDRVGLEIFRPCNKSCFIFNGGENFLLAAVVEEELTSPDVWFCRKQRPDNSLL